MKASSKGDGEPDVQPGEATELDAAIAANLKELGCGS